MIITVNPTQRYCSKGSKTYSNQDVTWQLEAEDIALYEIESMGVRFTRQRAGYQFNISDRTVSPAEEISGCYYESYSTVQSGEETVYLQVPQSYWGARTSGHVWLLFKSPLYDQTYSNIDFVISLKPKATASTGTSDMVAVGQSQTITLQNSTLSQVSHKISWQYGSVTGTTTTVQGAQTSSWSVPSADFGTVCSANPSGTIVTGTATIETYFGSEQTQSTYIGSTSIDIKLNIPEDSNTKPVSTSTVTIAKQSDSPNVQNKYFQNFTNLTVTPAATTKYGATLVACQVVVTNNNTVVFSQSIPISKQTTFDHVVWAPGTNTVNVIVIDSRGFTNSNQAGQDVVLTVYSLPIISDVTVQRYNLDTQQVDDEGTAMQVTITASFDSSAGAGSTPYTAVVKEGSTTVAQKSDTQNVLIVGDATHTTSPERTYIVNVTITDGYGMSSSVSVDIGTSTYTIYRMAGGKGVSFGKAADKFGVEVNEDWPFYTHGQEIQEMLLDYAHPVGSVIQSLDANFDPNVQWPWTQWGKLENVFLLGSGMRTVLDIGGSETQTSAFSATIPAQQITLTADNMPRSTIFGYGDADVPKYSGTRQTSERTHGQVEGYHYIDFIGDDQVPISIPSQTVSVSSTITTLPPYITVNIWVRAR